MRLKLAGTAAIAAVLVLAGCASGTDDESTEATDTTTTEATDEAAEDVGTEGTIVAVVAEDQDLSTLAQAIEEAGLNATLEQEGPFTLFAPTNEAFDALPDGVLDALLLPENQDTLVAVLSYHVVAGDQTANVLTDGTTLATEEGQEVTISANGEVMVNEATVITPDVLAANGIIHIIDAVLIPPDVDPSSLVE